MPIKKIKKGDLVQMICGKDKGKRGKVIKVLPKENRVVVEGLNLVKKHQKPKRAGQKGQIVLVPRPVDVSNVMLVCPHCGKPTRVGFQGKRPNKVRICKKCKSVI